MAVTELSGPALRCVAVMDNRIGKEAYSILAVYDHILYRV